MLDRILDCILWTTEHIFFLYVRTRYDPTLSKEKFIQLKQIHQTAARIVYGRFHKAEKYKLLFLNYLVNRIEEKQWYSKPFKYIEDQLILVLFPHQIKPKHINSILDFDQTEQCWLNNNVGRRRWRITQDSELNFTVRFRHQTDLMAYKLIYGDQ